MMNFEEQFAASMGRPIELNGTTYYLGYCIKLGNHAHMHVEFKTANSVHRQGIRLESEKTLTIDGKESSVFILWHDTAPSNVICECEPNDEVWIWNVWGRKDGQADSRHGGAAMIVEPLGEAAWKFRCNDVEEDEDFDDLIFEIRLMANGQ